MSISSVVRAVRVFMDLSIGLFTWNQNYEIFPTGKSDIFYMILEYTSISMTEKELFEHVLHHAPALKLLLERYGNLSVYDYGKTFYKNSNTSPQKETFLQLIESYTHWKHGMHMSKKVRESLEKNYVVATSDHHGPMGHPFFFQSSILRGLVHPAHPIINLCTSHVSLWNSSYPRGFMLQGDTKNIPLYLPFFSASKRMSPVFSYPAFTEKDIQTYCLPKLAQHLSRWNLSTEKADKIRRWFEQNLLHSHIIEQKTYSNQITLINGRLWSDIFPQNMPDFIPLDGEDFVRYILIEHIKIGGFLTTLLWWDGIHESIEQNFDKISCCFDIKGKKGTYLFWYLDENNHRHALWRKWDSLESETSTVHIRLEKESLLDALQKGYIIPSGLLMYTILAGYYGLRCFGGYAQGTYLPDVLTAYEKTVSQSIDIPESILCEDMIFSHTEKWTITTALDMLYNPSLADTKKLLSDAKNTSLEESIKSMLPEIARCISF